jgi:hypothetical protein
MADVQSEINTLAWHSGLHLKISLLSGHSIPCEKISPPHPPDMNSS